MMPKIRQLDEALSNMIAAGEVVENPASVVKELVENALDAESTTITIHLKEYGLKSIKVIDDGIGMDAEDLSMAFKRHATSKIRTHHDLFHIASLGFRGEALPSIASVSELTIESTDGLETANQLTLKNGEVIEKTLSSIKKGTAITVDDLFYNTPARLKHLKSETKELAYIVEHIHKIALSHPQVRFHLTHDQKVLFSSSGDGNISKILYQIYGSDIAKNLLPFQSENSYFKIKGYACKPMFTRSSRQHITLIANKRLIKNTRVIQAVMDGYRTYLPMKKYPIVHLEISVDPLLIDINIHPQKLEIKFTEENSLLRLISSTILKTLEAAYLVPKVQKHEPRENNQTKMVFHKPSQLEELSENYQLDLNVDTSDQVNPLKRSEKRFPELEYIGQYHGTYLIFQSEEGLYLVDQHAAAERIRYERYYREMSKDNNIRKPLLVPFEMRLSKSEVIAAQTILEALKSFGLTIKLEENKLMVFEVPAWFMERDEEGYAEMMISRMLDEQEVSIGVLIDQLAKDLSCKHSIKANKFITKEEVDKLMSDLSVQKNPFTCPHGRPTMIHFTTSELERLFKRVQS